MRRRSETIKADSFEEFFQLSISKSPEYLFSDPSALIESPYCHFTSNSEWFEDSPNFSGPKQKLLSFPSDMIEEDSSEDYFHITTPSTDTGSNKFSAQANSLFSSQENSLSRFCKTTGFEGKVKYHGEMETTGVLHKAMVVGSMGSGRHTIINSLFKEEKENLSNSDPKIRNALDLLIRSKKEKEQTQRFKFWIRDPSYQKFDPLIKVYYKSIDYYIFLYKAGDRKSLECAERAIQEVLNEVPSQRFKGLLIGNSFGEEFESGENLAEEGEKVKAKYGLERFIEIGDLEEEGGERFNREVMGFLGCL